MIADARIVNPGFFIEVDTVNRDTHYFFSDGDQLLAAKMALISGMGEALDAFPKDHPNPQLQDIEDVLDNVTSTMAFLRLDQVDEGVLMNILMRTEFMFIPEDLNNDALRTYEGVRVSGSETTVVVKDKIVHFKKYDCLPKVAAYLVSLESVLLAFETAREAALDVSDEHEGEENAEA